MAHGVPDAEGPRLRDSKLRSALSSPLHLRDRYDIVATNMVRTT
jgi:hypothetical protein